MSFERKNDGTGSCHFYDVRYSETTDSLLITLLHAPQKHFNESLSTMKQPPSSVHQGFPTIPIDVQTFAGDLRSVRTDPASLLQRSAGMRRRKTALPTLNASEHSLENMIEEEVPIFKKERRWTSCSSN